jgi:hypothetical protein
MRSEQGRSRARAPLVVGKTHGLKNEIGSSISRRMKFEKNLSGGGVGKDKYHYDEFFKPGFVRTKRLEPEGARDSG